MNHHNEALELLTEDYQPIAQMTIALAYQLDYIGHPEYAIVNPLGDDTSAGLPYFIEATHSTVGFQFLSYDTTWLITVPPDYQILVYRKPPLPVFSDDEQIDMLDQFASQFPEDSLMRQFLTVNLIEWLRRNKDKPNIYGDVLHMKNAAYRLEDHIRNLENLYNDHFPY
jgi:hypothetical protein